MKQKKMTLISKDVKLMFETNLNPIIQLAMNSHSADEFKKQLMSYLRLDEEILSPAKENMRTLCSYDGRNIMEASTEMEIKINTLTLLWKFLKEEKPHETIQVDFLLDIYHQLDAIYNPTPSLPSSQKVMRWMRKWPVGTESSIIEIRNSNKQRIIAHLIKRIENHHAKNSRYTFPDDINEIEKKAMVELWWTDFRFHLAMAARSLKELNLMMGNTLSSETKSIYQKANKKGIPIFVTPYYLSLMDVTQKQYDDVALRSYVFYSQELIDTFGEIKAWEKEDKVEPNKPNAAGWILPEGNNIHRRYPEVAILIPDTIGRACGGLCASCQRLYDFQSGRFNFDLESLRPKETWDSKLKRLMNYFREDRHLRDILITGGDALMSTNASITKILNAVYTMAKQKRDDNKNRKDGEKYAEIQRVRLGTRLPVYLPMRIDDELKTILAEFKEKAESVGIKQFFIQTHFQTPLEITPEALEGIRKLHEAGWTITNQLVFNVAASRRGHNAKLRQELNKIGVLSYYTFSVKGFEENHAVFTPNSRSIQEQLEEKVFGRMSQNEALTLMESLEIMKSHEKAIRLCQKQFHLPFLATDRNVMNLPGIGKSMVFNVVGILADGRRILAFKHDNTRKHSSVIKDMPIVYIKENKSISEYLRQLQNMGENVDDYNSIWNYNSGSLEPRFSLYEYPRFRYEE